MPRESSRFENPDKVSVLSPARVYVEEALSQVDKLPLLHKPDFSKRDHPADETTESHPSNHVEDRRADVETAIISNIPSVDKDENIANTFSILASCRESQADLISLHKATTEVHQEKPIFEGVIITSSPMKYFVGVLPAVPIEAHDRDVDGPSSGKENLSSPHRGSMLSSQAFQTTPSEKEHTAIKMSASAEAASDESQSFLIINCEKTLEQTSQKSILTASADLSADNCTPNHSNSLEDIALVERKKICISGMSPIKADPQKSSAEQIIMGGQETSQQIESVAIDESLPINSFKVDSSASRGDSISPGGDTPDTLDEPSRGTSSLLAETCEPSLCHGSLETENVELKSDVSSQPVEDKDPVTDNPKPGTNADDAEIKKNPESKQDQTEGPGRRTRSVTRFSDDTKMLKDFVNRVQARKAANIIPIPVYVAAPMTSPRRSPRKALAEVDKNSPSPQKPHDLANRPGTPPGDRKLGFIDSDDLDEIAVEQTPCRRSTRTRLIAPSTTAVEAPSFIPVRRPDGEAIVRLQKSQAQQLATITRANTKRNKGQSKPVKVTLEKLPAEASEDAIELSGGREESRAVGWDEKLVYYQDRSEWKEGKTEKRRKARRTRNLGSTNGTPARRKMVTEMDNSNGASAARDRSKSKGKC